MLTVVFSTYNGEYTLRRTLTSFCNVVEPAGGWVLIVVDNASKDSSKEIIFEFKDKLPIRYVYEGRRGKNKALNSGLAHRAGDLVIFTDDDVIVDPQWLVQYRKVADEHPDCDVFGGPIQPFWEVQPPSWLLDAIPIGPAFALTPEEMRTGTTDVPKFWGPNMAIRTKHFDDGLRFNENVGPGEGQYMMGSETELLKRLMEKGTKGWCSELIKVQHIIRPWQLKTDWIKNRAFRFGRACFFRHVIEGNLRESRRLRGVPLWLIRQQTNNYIKLFGSYISFNRREIMKCNWEIGMKRGIMFEYKRMKVYSNSSFIAGQEAQRES